MSITVDKWGFVVSMKFDNPTTRLGLKKDEVEDASEKKTEEK